jgi:hypothetical protein
MTSGLAHTLNYEFQFEPFVNPLQAKHSGLKVVVAASNYDPSSNS